MQPAALYVGAIVVILIVVIAFFAWWHGRALAPSPAAASATPAAQLPPQVATVAATPAAQLPPRVATVAATQVASSVEWPSPKVAASAAMQAAISVAAADPVAAAAVKFLVAARRAIDMGVLVARLWAPDQLPPDDQFSGPPFFSGVVPPYLRTVGIAAAQTTAAIKMALKSMEASMQTPVSLQYAPVSAFAVGSNAMANVALRSLERLGCFTKAPFPAAAARHSPLWPPLLATR